MYHQLYQTQHNSLSYKAMKKTQDSTGSESYAFPGFIDSSVALDCNASDVWLFSTTNLQNLAADKICRWNCPSSHLKASNSVFSVWGSRLCHRGKTTSILYITDFHYWFHHLSSFWQGFTIISTMIITFVDLNTARFKRQMASGTMSAKYWWSLNRTKHSEITKFLPC